MYQLHKEKAPGVYPATTGVESFQMSMESASTQQLYRLYRQQIERRCLRMLGNRHDAEDAAHDVFVTMISKGSEFRGESDWYTWLYRIAYNLCVNRNKYKTIRNTRWKQEVRGVQNKRAITDPEKSISTRQIIEKALEKCDSSTRDTARHYFSDDMTQEEIGQLLGVSRNTVNRRLRRFKTLVCDLMFSG